MADDHDASQLTSDNYSYKVFRFDDRQAGISLVYDPIDEAFAYNAYCVEITLMKELYSSEFEFLEDALEHVNQEFGTWQLAEFGQESEKSGCGSCANKKN